MKQQHDDTASADQELGRKRVFCFRTQSDIDLLKEVMNYKPFKVSHRQVTQTWDSIATELCSIYGASSVKGSAAKRRFKELLAKFKKDKLDSLRASRMEEEFDQREQLLTDIRLLMEEAEAGKALATGSKKEAFGKCESNGNLIHQAAMNQMANKSKMPQAVSNESVSVSESLGSMEDKDHHQIW